jgi:hypothetical protein
MMSPKSCGIVTDTNYSTIVNIATGADVHHDPATNDSSQTNIL